jgi:hypothetical protein
VGKLADREYSSFSGAQISVHSKYSHNIRPCMATMTFMALCKLSRGLPQPLLHWKGAFKGQMEGSDEFARNERNEYNVR